MVTTARRCGLADGRVAQRLLEQHPRPDPSIFGDSVLDRVAYGTREGQRIEAPPPDARLGLPEGKFSYAFKTGIRLGWWRIPTTRSTRCWRACWA